MYYSVSIFLKLLLITIEVVMNLLQPAAMNMENHSQNNKEEEVAGSLVLRIWAFLSSFYIPTENEHFSTLCLKAYFPFSIFQLVAHYLQVMLVFTASGVVSCFRNEVSTQAINF